MGGAVTVVAQSSSVPVIDAVFVFVVSLIIGAIGIYTGARLLIDEDTSFWLALVTAFLGAVVWGVVAFFIGWIPILGPLLTLIVWIGFINWQYPGGWGTAIGIAVVAWIVTAVILYILNVLGVVGLTAIGVP